MDKWRVFEEGKRRLAAMELTQREYEKEIRLLCQRLGI